jgi:hypothetical protein
LRHHATTRTIAQIATAAASDRHAAQGGNCIERR